MQSKGLSRVFSNTIVQSVILCRNMVERDELQQMNYLPEGCLSETAEMTFCGRKVFGITDPKLEKGGT